MSYYFRWADNDDKNSKQSMEGFFLQINCCIYKTLWYFRTISTNLWQNLYSKYCRCYDEILWQWVNSIEGIGNQPKSHYSFMELYHTLRNVGVEAVKAIFELLHCDVTINVALICRPNVKKNIGENLYLYPNTTERISPLWRKLAVNINSVGPLFDWNHCVLYFVNSNLCITSRAYITMRMAKDFQIPVSQFCPVYPAEQLQAKRLMRSMQVPPLTHGSEPHSLISKNIN